MKKQLLLFCAILFGSIAEYTTAQDCTNGRYKLPLFTVDSIMNVRYGANVDQDGVDSVELFMDIYFPQGDTDTDRPLVLLAHGGSFIGGSKEDMSAECRLFSSLGYVTATIKYRLLNVTPAILTGDIGLAFKKEVLRAMHDMKSAIRFFRKSVAQDGNPYGINPDIIIAGGVSAGAILSNHITYLDKTSEIPSELTSYAASQGGIEGKSGNAGYSSEPQLSISWCGAILDTSWIVAGDQPYVGVHNLDDQTVPNMEGQPNIGLPVPVTLQGDSLIYKRTLNVGVPSQYMSVPGNQHCVFPPEAIPFVTDFVHDQVCNQNLAVNENSMEVEFSIYPNPADEKFLIEIPSNQWHWNLSISNALGQEIYAGKINSAQNQIEVNSSNFEAGIYTVKLYTEDGRTAFKKMVIQ